MRHGPDDVDAIRARLTGRRPTWIEIDLDALAHNLGAIGDASGGRPAWAVVKADAYGHGAVPCARRLVEAGVHGLVVALPEEAYELRDAGITVPVLLSGPLPAGGARPLIARDVTASISSVTDLEILQRDAGALGKTASYHLELDTGMARMGLPPEHLDVFLAAAARADACRLEGLLSHLASVREPASSMSREQLARLRPLIDAVRTAAGRDVPVHLAASPALCRFPDALLDAVRPGLLLYGVRPHPQIEASMSLRPVLTLRAGVVLVRELEAGVPVGYEGTWVTERPSRIAVLGAGYADGLQPVLAEDAEALIDGRRCAYRGAINMDLAQVEIPAGTTVSPGDTATLIGADGDDAITVEELARRSGLSAYRWLTGLGPRVPRVYLSHGSVGDLLPAAGVGPKSHGLC